MEKHRQKALDDITSHLKQFHVTDLKDVAVTVLGISWNVVKYHISSNKLKYTKKVLVDVIMKQLKRANPTFAVLQVHQLNIKFTIVTRQSKRYCWYAFKLMHFQARELTQRELYYNIKDACKEVKVVGSNYQVRIFQSLLWILFAIPNQAKGSSIGLFDNPHFFVYKPGTKYLLCLKKTFQNPVTRVIEKTFGNARLKPIELEGHHVESLFRMLLNRRKITADEPDVVYDENVVAREYEYGLDFTCNSRRSEYAKERFGDEPPNLQKFTFQSENATWQATDDVPSMAGETFDCTVTFSSPNVFEMMKELVEEGVVLDPNALPIRKMLHCGKNKLRFKTQE